MQCKAISKVEKLILHLKQVNDLLLPPNSNDTALPSIPLYFQKWLKFGEIIVELITENQYNFNFRNDAK